MDQQASPENYSNLSDGASQSDEYPRSTKLEERLRTRLTELLTELEAKASVVAIKARRNTVEVKVTPVKDDKLPDPPADDDANPVSG